MLTAPQAFALWSAIGARRPLVYQLTNFVVVNEQAHVTLAIGAAPLMSLHPGEAEALVAIADAVVVNIGTPTSEGIEAMKRAATAATKARKPLLIDPVGYGATELRTHLVDELLAHSRPSLVKGNAGEMGLLGRAGGSVRGVDAASAGNVAVAVETIARDHQTIAIATGEIDWASDGRRTVQVAGGHALLTRLTGTGCWLGAVVVAAVAASPDQPLEAAVAALAAYGIAAEAAAKRAGGLGPASFRTAFIDALGELEERDFAGVDKRLCVAPAGVL